MADDPAAQARRKLLEQRLRDAAGGASRRRTISSRRSGPEVPLSRQQQQLWLIDRLNPGLSAYNVPSAWKLRGQLDVALLEQSLGVLVERHEILRTTYGANEGLPYQRVGAPGEWKIPVTDLRALPPAEREAEAHRLEVEDAQAPFSLQAGPVLRVQLARLADDEWLLLLCIHHIATDLLSMALLFGELSQVYGAKAAGARQPPLAPPELQYGDYACWQREQPSGGAAEAHAEFWKKQLRDVPPLELPLDRPRPQLPSYRGAEVRFSLSREVSAAVGALARAEGGTAFMVLLAAFEVLLHRYTGQVDFAVGTPAAGRDLPELESLVGYFVKTLAVRADLAGRPTFRQAVGRVRQALLEAYAHQDVHFEQVVELVQPDRVAGRNPLFQVMFAYEDIDPEELTLPGLRIVPVRPHVGTEQFDMTLHAGEEGDSFAGVLSGSADLFDAATIERMVGHLQRLLESIAQDPDAPVGELALLGPAERRALLSPVATRAYPKARCVQRLFEERVAIDGDRPAVVFEGQRVTYRELNRRANQLAHHLRSLGVTGETMVALYLDRSIEMVVAILGVLKAGGAYVPIDPVYPADRVAFMLEDAGAPVLISQTALIDRLAGRTHRAKVLCLDRDWGSIEDATDGGAPPALATGPGGVAYVIYTSGSTGRPKGVQILHENVVRLLTATDDWYHFGPRDVWTLFHSYAFDFSVWELWGALAYGGAVVVVPQEVARSPQDFLELLRAEKVTVLNQTPAAFRALIAADQASTSPVPLSLRYVIFGGEALELASLRPWVDKHGDTAPRLINMYGITETTVHVTYRPLARAEIESARGSVVGRPIPDQHVRILDDYRNPVPIGVVGEMYVGGEGLARGYLNRPELTAERFVPDPFARAPGGRLYKSGDLARWLPGGDIEYVGRADFQVKLRGFRIELGEVESALLQQPAVREAVVVAREEGGDKRLVAYVVAKMGARVAAQELRGALKKALPEYMVPSAFVALEKLPLTPNGKVDRKALPAPDFGAARSEYVAPRTPLEETLAAIWAQVLGVDRVGVHDNFFEIGGDSLKVVRVVALAGKAGTELSPAMIFTHPTIAGLATQLETAPGGREDWTRRVLTVSAGAARLAPATPVPLAFPEERFARLWFALRSAGDKGMPIIAGYGLQGPLDHLALEAAVSAVVGRRAVLWGRYALLGQQIEKRLETPRALELPLLDLSFVPEAARAAAAMSDMAQHQYECDALTDAPPRFRAKLYRLGVEHHALFLSAAHTCFDAVSWGIVSRELVAAYGRARAGDPPETRLAPLQYEDFAVCQRQWYQGPWLEEAVAWWRARLDGAQPAARQLRSDLPRGPVDERRAQDPLALFPFGTLPFGLDPAVTAALRALAGSEGTVMSAVVMAAFAAAVGHRAGGSDLVFSSIGDARRRFGGLSEVVGCFVSPILVRVRMADHPSYRELLGRVHQELFTVMGVPELPLVPFVFPRYNDHFRVAFNFVGAQEPLQWPGFELSELPWFAHRHLFAAETSFLDWYFQVGETPGAGLSGFARFNRALWSESAAAGVLTEMREVLVAAARDPDARTASR